MGKLYFSLWKYDLLTFKATSHSTYATLAFEFVAQIECLLSERRAAQLLHNRTVNFYGGLGKNVPIDYAVELLNGEVKQDLKHKFGKLTDKTIERVGKSLRQCRLVENNVDIQLELFDAIGRHKAQLFEKDVTLMVEELKKEDLFKFQQGRAYSSFPKMKKDRHSTLSKKALDDWIMGQKLKKAQKQRMQNIINQMS